MEEDLTRLRMLSHFCIWLIVSRLITSEFWQD